MTDKSLKLTEHKETKKTLTSKHKVIIILVTSCVVVLLAIAWALWYNYQNNNSRILGRAAKQLLTAKNVSFDGTTMRISVSGSGTPDMNMEYTFTKFGMSSQNDVGFESEMKIKSGVVTMKVGVDAVYSHEGDVYFRLRGLSSTLKAIQSVSSDSSETDQAMVAAMEEISDQWIRISKSTLDEISGDTQIGTTIHDAYTCLIDNDSAELSDNDVKQFIDEVAGADFFSAERIGSDELDGRKAWQYDVSMDFDNYSSFIEAYENVEAMQPAMECSESLSSLLTGLGSDESLTTYTLSGETIPLSQGTLWIDKSTLEPFRFQVSGSNPMYYDEYSEYGYSYPSAYMSFMFDFHVQLNPDEQNLIKVPTEFVDFEDLSEGLTQLVSTATI